MQQKNESSQERSRQRSRERTKDKRKRKQKNEEKSEEKQQKEKTNFGRWTSEEHNIFLQAYQIYGKNWKKIADIMKNRDSSQVRSHAQKYFYKLEKDNAKKIAPVMLDRGRQLRTRRPQLYHQIHRQVIREENTPSVSSQQIQKPPTVIITQQNNSLVFPIPEVFNEQSRRFQALMTQIPGQIMLPISYFMEYVYPIIISKDATVEEMIQNNNNHTNVQPHNVNPTNQNPTNTNPTNPNQTNQNGIPNPSSLSAFKPFKDN